MYRLQYNQKSREENKVHELVPIPTTDTTRSANELQLWQEEGSTPVPGDLLELVKKYNTLLMIFMHHGFATEHSATSYPLIPPATITAPGERIWGSSDCRNTSKSQGNRTAIVYITLGPF